MTSGGKFGVVTRDIYAITVPFIYNFIFTRVFLHGATTQVCVDHIPHSVECVTSRVCHACNVIFHAWNIMLHVWHTRDMTYSTLRGMWST